MARRLPLDRREVQDHVSNIEADHAEDAAARASDRQAVVLERRAEEVACAWAVAIQGPSGLLATWLMAQMLGASEAALVDTYTYHRHTLMLVMAGRARRHASST